MTTPSRRAHHARRALAVIAGIGTVSLLLAGCTRPSAARDTDDPAEFFEGQTIRWIVPFEAGGGTDTSARALVPILTEHLPGNPKIQIENIEGGNGVLGTNEFAKTDADGLTILMTSSSTNTAVLFGDPAVQFDYNDFTPIAGVPAGGTQYVAPSTGVTDPLSLLDTTNPLIYGGITPGGGEFPRILGMDLLGLDVEHVWGYQSRSAVQIAFSQGEVTIDGQSTAAYLESIAPLVDRGEATPVYSIGFMEGDELVRDSAFPELPHAVELYEQKHGTLPDPDMLEAYKFLVLIGQNLQKQLWIRDGAPEVAVEAFQQAFIDMQKDPDFEAVRDALGGYDLLVGESLESDVAAALYDPPQEIIDWLAEYAKREYGADLSRG
ncbi:tripartite tricarboxylate transporter substrate-binding protein [Microbacterium sp. zg.Y625]|uniref:tripartite tricarboxylate transporter substrate-binding protein n=1 Tax=Microbacterium jiangjiandongii TaxID=3049071 RepID=UPI00214AC310|nr:MULTISPECIES: tripartite tricarboxylate transporter substrate-binding protein [unclassified Microbacterium]MCR2793276.1 tripartite tricarboxylate transporter substrate-binding protein [Microbacterium sp. zg.Y625]WIM25347.1 tripartite tricarboxylate transporter substrate-binding protein [Microbacterium sp. zg-Y625]